MAAQKFQAFTFVVTGSGHFPVDMTRYDRAVPHSQDDLSTAYAQKDARRVKMIAFTPVGNRTEPTAARWLSFGWTVEPGSVQVVRT